MSLQRFKTLALVSLVTIVVAIPLYVLKTLAGKQASVESVDAPATFVGRQKCVDCHKAAFEAWQGSDHDLAMDEANETTVVGDFDDSVFEYAGVVSRFFRRDGEFWVHTEGPEGTLEEFRITHTFGFEPLQQYLIPFPGGRLQALSIAWDTENERWFRMYPDQEIPAGDWLHWTRNGQNWNGMCAECHSTNLRKNYDPETKSYDTTWSEIDVSCEACHGPGSRHVAWAEIEPMARRESEDFELVVSTRELTSREQVELCAPCHSRRAELGDYDHTGGEMLDRHVPSLLEEILYHADGQILDEVYVYGSFAQSKMFHNAVRCSDCHDVHTTKLLREGNQLCAPCHRPDTYDSYDHHFHKKVHEGKPSDGALCVKCHMPEQPYMVVDWRADHSMRVPRPDLTDEIGTPNSCAQANCHADKPNSWSVDAFRKWYGIARKPHYGTILAAGRAGEPDAAGPLAELSGNLLYPAIVRATAVSLLAGFPGPETTSAMLLALQDEEPLVRHAALRGVAAADPQRLVELIAPLLFDPARAVRMQAVIRLAPLGPENLKPYQRAAFDEAMGEYVEAMDYSLDFASSGMNLGNLYAALGRVDEAEAAYRGALEIDDLFFPAKMNLAVLFNTRGRNQEAERLLREVVRDYPEQHDAAYSLALLLVEMERPAEAVEPLRAAVEGQPGNPRMHYNLGLLLQQLGRPEDAESSLRQALSLEPENLDYLYVLAEHYLRRGRLGEARTIADRMIAYHPENPIGQELKTYIDQQ